MSSERRGVKLKWEEETKMPIFPYLNFNFVEAKVKFKTAKGIEKWETKRPRRTWTEDVDVTTVLG